MKKGWEIKKLGEVSKITYGYTEKASFTNIGPKFLRITDIKDDGVNWNLVPFCKISNEDFKKYRLDDSDIVFARTGATTGKSYLLNKPPKSVFASYLIKVKIIQTGLFPKFLYLFFQTDRYWKFINEGITGSAQGGFNATKLSDIQIPLPPIHEQKQIVGRLDKAFESIEKAKANAQRNLEYAKVLFESYLDSIFKNKGDGWEERKLCDVFELRPMKKEARDKLKETDLVTFLPMEDLGILNKEIVGIKERQLKDVVRCYTYFAVNDVLLAKITPCFENGKIGIARKLINGIGFGSSEYFVFRSKGYINPDYLYYFLSQTRIRNEGKKYMGGAVGHKRLSKDWIENYIIPFPKSLKEQESIIKTLDSLSVKMKKLDTIYKNKIEGLEELKKSILQKAFNGELKTEKEIAE